ncbi:MAG: lyase [Gammaproteobacteria bacterium]|nr:lyase [Gammaproteobacteria bacterium]
MIRICTLLIVLCIVTNPNCAHGQTVEIREWLVPWEESAPSDAFVGPRGRIWFVSVENDFIANFQPDSGEFNRYDLQKGTKPVALLVDADRILWFLSAGRQEIGSINPATGRVSKFDMPQRRARDPRSMIFDQNGNIWFTVSRDNFIGRLDVATGATSMIAVPTKDASPFGITAGAGNELWIAASGKNLLLRVDADTMSIAEIAIPDESARPRRIAVSSDNRVWYADYARGKLGRFDPARGDFAEWSMPGGEDSQPFGMAIDRNDRIWIVETGSIPNRLIGFDTATGSFLTETDIPSSAELVSHLFYHEPAGEVWFGTQTNYIGRAIVH